MSIERAIQGHLAATASVGAALLGVSQKNPLLPVLVVFGSVTAIVFTDLLEWFVVHRFVANAAAVLALMLSMDGFLRSDTHQQLAAIGTLLVYLQLTLFYQRKTGRLYWQVLVLSLLQVVIAAAVETGIEFGVMLIVYALLALATMRFLFVQREAEQVASAARPWRWRVAAVAGGGGEPWLQRGPVFVPPGPPSALAKQIAGRGLWRHVAVIGGTSLALALVLFYAAPRLDSDLRRALRRRSQSYPVFPTTVKLGDRRAIPTNDEPVLRVRFRDSKPFRVSGEPYLRGVVLTEYEFKAGEGLWHRPADHGERALRELARGSQGTAVRAPPAGQRLVRQEFVLEPTLGNVLFAVEPVYAAEDTPPDVRYEPLEWRLYRHREERETVPTEYRYAVTTTGFRSVLQRDLIPETMWGQASAARQLLEWETQSMTGRFPGLQTKATAVVAGLGPAPPTRLAVAQAMQAHFRDTGMYRYTLNLRGITRQAQLDPLEDFVINHRSGHCEYFAGALVLMLRSQGIPARLVLGYRGGDYNTVGSYYQMRYLHAHAWVEAYLGPDDVGEAALAADESYPNGAWLRLDPTPPDDSDKKDQAKSGFMQMADDVLDYARLLWTDYVLGLTSQRQRESIYDPLTEKADPETWNAWLQAKQKSLRDWLRAIRFGWGAGWTCALLGVLVLATVARRFFRRSAAPSLVAQVRRWRARRADPHHRRPSAARVVDFFQRFEALLAHRGLVRRPGETAREFAAGLRTRLRPAPLAAAAAAVPGFLTEAFYRVRFGRAVLSPDELAALDEALTVLEQALTAPQPAAVPVH